MELFMGGHRDKYGRILLMGLSIDVKIWKEIVDEIEREKLSVKIVIREQFSNSRPDQTK